MSCKRITAGNYYDIMNENDYRNALDFAKKKGMLEGHKKGMQQGVRQGMQRGIMQVARTMLSSGMDADSVAALTGLSMEQIKRLN